MSLYSVRNITLVRGSAVLSFLWLVSLQSFAQLLPTDAYVQSSAVDSTGYIYVAGYVQTPNLPTTPGVFQPKPVIDCSGDPFCAYGFAAKVAPAGDKLVWATYLGGGGTNSPTALAVAPEGSVYVAGSTHLKNFLPTLGGYQTTPAGLFIARLSNDGSSLVSATYFGGTGTTYVVGGNQTDSVAVMKLDSAGNVYIAGNATRPNGEVVIAGFASPAKLIPTGGGPGACGAAGYYSGKGYISRLRAPALDVAYTGCVSSDRLPMMLLGTDRVLVSYPYGTLTPLAILPAGPPLPGTVTCLANAATYNSEAIAPGELVAMFGSQIGPDVPLGMELDAQGNVTKNLGGLSVYVDGLPAPMLYAGPNQINIVVPFGIHDARQVRVELRRDSTVVAGFDKSRLPTQVGLFGTAGSSVGALAVINQDGTANSASNPAPLGTVISIYGTGFGAMAPQATDGERPPLPEGKPVADVSVQVNGQPARVEYAGNAPTLVQGVVQINVRLPQDLAEAPGLAPNTAGITVNAGAFEDRNASWSYGVIYVR